MHILNIASAIKKMPANDLKTVYLKTIINELDLFKKEAIIQGNAGKNFFCYLII